MGGHTSSYAAAGMTLEFIGAHKPPHPATKCFRQGGDTIDENVKSISLSNLNRIGKVCLPNAFTSFTFLLIYFR
jgi:hypothetical protein